jgi:hypothetical protein
VRGSGFTNLRSLLLDGVATTELVVRSDSVAEFRVPAMRACETDMRAVKVSADEDYVLSAASVAIPTAAAPPRTLVAVRVLGTGDAAASTRSTSRCDPIRWPGRKPGSTRPAFTGRFSSECS